MSNNQTLIWISFTFHSSQMPNKDTLKRNNSGRDFDENFEKSYLNFDKEFEWDTEDFQVNMVHNCWVNT
jgi:hypothetical protein